MAEARSSLTSRALGAGRALVGVHLDLAQQEAAEDAGRVGLAAVLLGLVAVLAAAALLLVDVALVAMAIDRYQLSLTLAALVVAAGHLAFALPLGLLAFSRLRKPVLKRTRGRMKETLTALRGS